MFSSELPISSFTAYTKSSTSLVPAGSYPSSCHHIVAVCITCRLSSQLNLTATNREKTEALAELRKDAKNNSLLNFQALDPNRQLKLLFKRDCCYEPLRLSLSHISLSYTGQNDLVFLWFSTRFYT